MTRYQVTHHGRTVYTADMEWECWSWLYGRSPSTVGWALDQGGYKIERVRDPQPTEEATR